MSTDFGSVCYKANFSLCVDLFTHPEYSLSAYRFPVLLGCIALPEDKAYPQLEKTGLLVTEDFSWSLRTGMEGGP